MKLLEVIAMESTEQTEKKRVGRKPGYTGKLDEILELLAGGLSVREVAMRTGVSKSAIGRVRRKAYGFTSQNERTVV